MSSTEPTWSIFSAMVLYVHTKSFTFTITTGTDSLVLSERFR